jgi:hypothetical protein
VIDPDDLAPDGGWALASLRIASEELNADQISELLGLRFTSARLADGEPAFTVWMYDSGLEPSSPIEDHLYILVERLRDRRDALIDLARRANVEIWLSYSPGTGVPRSAVFDHAVLAELGALGVDLVFEPYAAKRRQRPAPA